MELSIVSGTYNRLLCMQQMVHTIRISIGVGVPYEIVLVDGGSTDGTIEWCKLQPDIVLLEQGELLGPVKAFNAGFAIARGKYVVIGNDDIEYVGDSILRAYVYMQDHPNTGMGCFYQDRDNRDWHVSVMGATAQSGEKIVVPYGQVCIVPKWLGDKVGWWGDYLHFYGGDNELTCNIYEAGYAVEAIPCACIHDKKLEDDLRKKTAVKAIHGAHPDSITWKKRWYTNRYGPVVKTRPVYKNTVECEVRILYAPIFAKSFVQLNKRVGLRNALSKVGVVYEYDFSNDGVNNLPDIVDAFNPDIVLTQFQNAVHATSSLVTSMKAAAKSSCVFVNWNGDYHPQELADRAYMDMMKLFHIATFTTADIKNAYVHHGINFHYLQSSWEEVRLQNNPIKRYDIAFLGNCYSRERMHIGMMLEKLRRKHGVLVHGSGWRKALHAAPSSLYDYDAGAEAYQSAKLIISDQQWPTATGYVSDRLFNSLHTGTCVLQQRFDGMNEYLGLEDGVHLLTYGKTRDLPDVIDHLFKIEKDFQSIGKAGKEFVDKHHSFDIRVRELMDIIHGSNNTDTSLH